MRNTPVDPGALRRNRGPRDGWFVMTDGDAILGRVRDRRRRRDRSAGVDAEREAAVPRRRRNWPPTMPNRDTPPVVPRA